MHAAQNIKQARPILSKAAFCDVMPPAAASRASVNFIYLGSKRFCAASELAETSLFFNDNK
jgi:hypothetical protein